MKLNFKAYVFACLFLALSFSTVRGQSIKIIGGDVLNGAITGLALGGATMAIQNSGDRAPLRFGLGAGILYGIGIGIYDVSIVPKGQRFYTSATFNSGHNSTIIVLLDTIYGAAAGAIVGTAVSLITHSPVVDGLQYGAGAGTWLGFGFGLIDSFVLAQGPRQLRASVIRPHRQDVQGIIRFALNSKRIKFGFIHPKIYSRQFIKNGYFKRDYSFGVEAINVNISL